MKSTTCRSSSGTSRSRRSRWPVTPITSGRRSGSVSMIIALRGARRHPHRRKAFWHCGCAAATALIRVGLLRRLRLRALAQGRYHLLDQAMHRLALPRLVGTAPVHAGDQEPPERPDLVAERHKLLGHRLRRAVDDATLDDGVDRHVAV